MPLAAGLAAFALGCTSGRTFNAEVIVGMPIGAVCAQNALAREPDVTEVIPTDESGFAFLLKEPGKDRKHWPAFGLVQGVDASGEMRLLLTTRYEAGFFETDTESRIERAKAIISAVAKACTGREPTWGETRPCGAGEAHVLCAKGR